MDKIKMQFRQKESGWCVIYTLANIFEEKRFLRYDGEEEYKGLGQKEEVKLIKEIINDKIGIAYLVDVTVGYNISVPEDFITQILLIDNDHTSSPGIDYPITPFCMSVRLKPGNIHTHRVAVLKSGRYYLYIDPYKKFVLPYTDISLPLLSDNFSQCYTIERFTMLDDDGQTRFMLLDPKAAHWGTVFKQLRKNYEEVEIQITLKE